MTEDERINTYKPCRKHGNGHSPDCKDCETECLRGLLREVAQCYDEWDDGADYHRVKIPNKLWDTIYPLRTPPVVEVKP